MLQRPRTPGSDGARRWRRHAGVGLFFLALTVLVTYPQVRGLATSVPHYGDPYFSIWRLAWVAHAVVTDPLRIFDANIFYPARNSFGYSDAMLLPGFLTAPLFWAGASPVLIYNLALFAAFSLSGWAAFVLARRLTGSVPGAIVAGVIFAFAPYRFCHYMHLELQIVFWIPIAMLVIHRVIESGRLRDGLLLGAIMSAQLFSSIYMALFSLVYLGVVMPALLLISGAHAVRRVLLPALAGALLAIAFAVPYAIAYGRAERDVGTRGIEEVKLYSATIRSFVSAPAMNRLYGWTEGSGLGWDSEMNLFPGILACALAALGVLRGRGRARFAYLAGLLIAIDMTRGASGFLFVWLFEHTSAFRALRSPARFDIFVNLSLALLSAYGAAFLLEKIGRPAGKRVAATALVALLLAEYASSPVLESVPAPTRVDSLLSARPPSVIVELPLLTRRGFWGSLDVVYMAQGVGHFQKMLNGYSGLVPGSFYQMREVMGRFPDERSMAFLRELGVDYVVVRAALFDGDEGAALIERLGQHDGLALEAMWMEGPGGREAIYRIKN
jgi:hypothetical protein